MNGNQNSSACTAPRPVAPSSDARAETCPRCGRNGRRFGERPISGKPIWHCLACGRGWQPRSAKRGVAF